ncbi:MAG TPA: hypothetical protein VIJ38_04715 [Acidobacteriaceae bacterium]
MTTDRFSPVVAEAMYGLVRHKNGVFNYRGTDVEMGQNDAGGALLCPSGSIFKREGHA